jgi:hypothetical protein
MFAACLAYCSTLKMGALRSSEMLVYFYRTVRCDIVEEYSSEIECVFFKVGIEHVSIF